MSQAHVSGQIFSNPLPRQGTVWVRVCTVFPLLGRYGIVLRRRLHESCLLFLALQPMFFYPVQSTDIRIS